LEVSHGAIAILRRNTQRRCRCDDFVTSTALLRYPHFNFLLRQTRIDLRHFSRDERRCMIRCQKHYSNTSGTAFHRFHQEEHLTDISRGPFFSYVTTFPLYLSCSFSERCFIFVFVFLDSAYTGSQPWYFSLHFPLTAWIAGRGLFAFILEHRHTPHGYEWEGLSGFTFVSRLFIFNVVHGGGDVWSQITTESACHSSDSELSLSPRLTV
jgi:hypothetical protein